jgi:hypothetical protein
MNGWKMRSALGASRLFEHASVPRVVESAREAYGRLATLLYAPRLVEARILQAYGLSLATLVAFLDDDAAQHLYFHQISRHLDTLGGLMVAPIFVSDERGEALLRRIIAILRGSVSPDSSLWTKEVHDWHIKGRHADKVSREARAGGRGGRRECGAIAIPPCMGRVLANVVGLWEGMLAADAIPLGVLGDCLVLLPERAAEHGLWKMHPHRCFG